MPEERRVCSTVIKVDTSGVGDRMIYSSDDLLNPLDDQVGEIWR